MEPPAVRESPDAAAEAVKYTFPLLTAPLLAPAAVNRRGFLSRTSQGLFGAALASLLEPGRRRRATCWGDCPCRKRPNG
jgi:hypothetical protein